MKHFTFLFLFLLIGSTSQAQTNMSNEIGYEVRAKYIKAIKKSQLQSVRTLKDINPGFPSSWIKDYISVEIKNDNGGQSMIASSQNDHLNTDQLTILQNAELGSQISVEVNYKSDQSIIGSETKTIQFSYTIIPESEASYPGGYSLLKHYLKQNMVDQIDESKASEIEMATVNFTVDKEGVINQIAISKTSYNDDIDKLLIQALSKMPRWNPAKDVNSQNVAQEFVLSFGSLIGC